MSATRKRYFIRLIARIAIFFGCLYMCSDLKKELLISLILLSITFLVPINLLFHMGSCIDLVIIYNTLSVISYLIKSKITRKGGSSYE